MGKKKSKTKIMKAAPLKVPKTFDCNFCGHS
jgi:transcription elongation factor Elf1